MKQICILTPCLMKDNNRKKNIEFVLRNAKVLSADKTIILGQCLNQADTKQLSCAGVEIFSNYNEPLGFVKSRNILLEYFYNSDYDYALWMDANSTISKSTLNTFLTVMKALKEEQIDVDAIFSSIGIMNNNERIKLAAADDYFDVAKLLPASKYSVTICSWLHGCFMKNYKKYYNHKVFIDTRCDPNEGLPEDAYLSTLIRKTFSNCYLCPSITVSKPPAKTSTWMSEMKNESGKPTYAYPPIKWEELKQLVKEQQSELVDKLKSSYIIELKRVDEYKDLLTSYQPRKRKQENDERNILF